MSSEQKLLILGLGNILLGDEGVGVHIINKLQTLALPGFVNIVDGGTMGIGLIDVISGYQEVLVVDAVKGKGLPDIRFFPLDKLIHKGAEDLSLHEIGLGSVLKLMDTLGMKLPEISILGVRPENTAPCSTPSVHCSEVIPMAIDMIMERIEGYKKRWKIR